VDNKTIGIVFSLVGIVGFLYSFSIETSRQIYFWTGIVLVIGGLLYARYAKD